MLQNFNLRVVGFTAFIVLILIIVWVSAYTEANYYFCISEEKTLEQLAHYGDSFGWVNTLLSIVAVVFASAAFAVQAKQYRKEIERSKLEDNKKSWEARPKFSAYAFDYTTFLSADFASGHVYIEVCIVNLGTGIRNVRADYLGPNMEPNQRSQRLAVMADDSPASRLSFKAVSPAGPKDHSVFVLVPLEYETAATERFDAQLKIFIRSSAINSRRKESCPIELVHCRQIPFDDPKIPLIDNETEFSDDLPS